MFGPEHPAASTDPTQIPAADWAYADLAYADAAGNATNTASYGAGSWQRTATGYDTHGNIIRELDARALAKVVADALPGEADQLATSTVYNPIDGGQACPVSVEVLSRGDTETSVGPATVIDDPATIGGYTGKLVGYASDTEQFWQATLDLEGGRRLVVRTPQDHGWDRGELDRFVQAIIVP